MIGRRPPNLPRLTINLFSGGKHAGGQVAIQDVLIVPAAPSISEGLALCHAIYQAAARHVQEKYQARALVADEGGLAPSFPSSTAMIEDAVESIRRAGLRPGVDAFLAVDVAATHFEHDNRYHIDGLELDSGGMIEVIRKWVRQYPIVSVEDG